MDIHDWLYRNRGFAGVLLGMGLIALHVTISRLIDWDAEASARLEELEAREVAHEQAQEQVRASRASAAAHAAAGESA